MLKEKKRLRFWRRSVATASGFCRVHRLPLEVTMEETQESLDISMMKRVALADFNVSFFDAPTTRPALTSMQESRPGFMTVSLPDQLQEELTRNIAHKQRLGAETVESVHSLGLEDEGAEESLDVAFNLPLSLPQQSIHNLQLNYLLPSNERMTSEIHTTRSNTAQSTDSQPSPQNPVSRLSRRTMGASNPDPDDTQPISQSVYTDLIRKQQQSFRDAPATDTIKTAETTVETQHSLQTGDDGHIELFANGADTQARSDVDEVEELISSPMKTQGIQYPESLRFANAEETPMVAEKRRDYLGRDLESTPALPGSAFPKGTFGDTMGLSQIFANTQAPTSPFVNGPMSDLVSDRPSPMIAIEQRPVSYAMSSPTAPTPGMLRPVRQPFPTYTSLEESQEERDRRAALHSEVGGSDDDDFGESSLVERHNRKRRREEETRRMFSSLGAAPTTASRPSSSRQLRKSPRFERVGVDATPRQIISPAESSRENSSEEETDKEDPAVVSASQRSQPPKSSSEEDKENFDTGIQVPATVARLQTVLDEPDEMGDQQSPSIRPSRNSQRFHSSNGGIVVAVANTQLSSQHTQPTLDPATSSIGPYLVPQSQLDRPAGKDYVSSSPIGPSWAPDQRDADEDDDEIDSPGLPAQPNEYEEDEMILVTSGASDMEIEPNTTLNGHDIAMEDRETLPQTIEETPSQVLRGSHNMTLVSTVPETSSAKLRGENTQRNETRQAMPTNANLLPPAITEHRASSPLDSPSGKRRRTMAEIASDPSPLDMAGDIDTDIGITTIEDREFRRVVGNASPVAEMSKRRKLHPMTGLNRISRPSFKSRTAPSPLHSSPVRAPNRAIQPGISSDARFTTPEPVEAEEKARNMDSSPESSSTPTRESSARRSLPRDTVESTPVASPSRKSRSESGASVWDVAPSPELRRPARQVLNGKARGKLVRPGASRRRRSHTALTEASATTDSTDPLHADEVTHAPRPPRANASATTPAPSLDKLAIIAPNNVFAYFNGRSFKGYYPAICQGVFDNGGVPRYRVLFEDTSPTNIDEAGIRRLDLREGDLVKVEMQGIPKASYVVTGFGPVIENIGPDSPMTDIYGRATVKVSLKSGRKTPQLAVAETEREVPVFALKIDTNIWGRYKDRIFSYTKLDQPVEPQRDVTPLRQLSTATTPQSRRTAMLQTSTPVVPITGLFAGMVFGISYIKDESTKEYVSGLIVQNGGRILADGFSELFHTPTMLDSSSVGTSTGPATPQSGHTATNDDSGTDSLQVLPSCHNLGFTALIADTHSRRLKYMQALALNIPCLSGHWITACVKQDRLVPWTPYLLPAGESALLGSAIRSRTTLSILPGMADATGKRLEDMVSAQNRLGFLNGDKVVLVMGKGKRMEGQIAYVFLCYALGASKVERVADAKALKTLLESSDGDETENERKGWNWILVDDSFEKSAKDTVRKFADTLAQSQSAAEDTSASTITTKPTSRRKTLPSNFGRTIRNRNQVLDSDDIESSPIQASASRPVETENTARAAAERSNVMVPRVVTNEFVIQSLILGSLYSDE